MEILQGFKTKPISTIMWFYGKPQLMHMEIFPAPVQRNAECARSKVETLIQAVQMCNVYGDVCVGFVLTRDMNIRLKHQVKRLSFDSQAVTLVKSAFVPRFGQTQLPKLFTSTNFSRPEN